ncbi:AsnC family transcriptional regulator [Zafaria sp. J156]|uniref:Lrp/AsnC family transcriptional regulator n=1 Tax=Zafaria sp. J156 TaxID=3116490 RepID=UPI002E78C412|nr:Lrp/AsnC family transcriptional regulator [Zafaria sp. J156]MEE1622401.1 Lrp/AsnC family transcriptional regulator [Zafaria sp. J156]
MNGNSISEDDARLIHALQISPRAPWSELSRALSASPSALAQRFARLYEAGLVRTTGHPTWINTRSHTAFAEIDVEPGALADVTDTLAELPTAMTLDATSSGTCLVATLNAPHPSALAAMLLETVPSLPGVRDVRAHVATSILKTGDRWNLRALEPEEAGRISGPRPPRARASRNLDPAFRSALMAELGRDARVPASVLARTLGVSEQKVHDGIAVVLHGDEFRLRTDVVNAWSGWPVHIWYFVEVPPRQLTAVAAALTAQPEVRYVGTSAGPANLTFDVWLRSLGVLHALEAKIDSLSQTGVKIRRQIVLRTPKRLGHLLDHDGRFTERYVVPPA